MAALLPVVDGARVANRVLIPENVTRGVVTLERIRGSIYISHAELFSALGDHLVTLGIQLVGVVNGVVPVTGILDPDNAADLESNRWIWRKQYSVTGSSFLVGAARQVMMAEPGPAELDIKSRRRFNRADWALFLTASTGLITPAEYFMGIDLRALFRSGDGL